MAYDLYPAVDTSYNFPPEVRQALAKSLELRNTVVPMTTTLRNNLQPSELWDGRVIANTTTDRLERYDATAVKWESIADLRDVQGSLTQAQGDARYVNIDGDTMTGPLRIQHPSAGSQLELRGTQGSAGIYWVDRNYFLFVGSDNLLRLTDGGGTVYRSILVGDPTYPQSAIHKTYLDASQGVNMGNATKQAGATWVTLDSWTWVSWPAATSLAIAVQLMGGFASADGDLTCRIVVSSGLTGVETTFPSQPTRGLAGHWTAVCGGSKGTIPANTACTLQLQAYTTAADGAYWSWNYHWNRR